MVQSVQLLATIWTCWVLNPRRGEIFHTPPRPALEPTQPPIQWTPGLTSGVRRPGRGVNHTTPSSAEVKRRVELYLYYPSGPSWLLLG